MNARARPADWFIGGEFMRPKGRNWPTETLRRLPGRAEAAIYGRVVLDCCDDSGQVITALVLSAVIRRRAEAAAALFKVRNLYPAARLVVVQR